MEQKMDEKIEEFKGLIGLHGQDYAHCKLV